jgi:hypothetical protein
MDQSLQSIIPFNTIGSQFKWWVGQVEKKDTKYSNRFKVRIVGRHLKTSSIVKTDDLPWAHTMLPVTTPYSDGNVTGATANLEVGNWVIGFFLDDDAQKPIIMGSIGHVANSTDEAPEAAADPEKSPELKVVKDPASNPAVHSPANKEVNKNDAGAPPGQDEKTVSNLLARLNAENSETNPGGIKFCVEIADPNCGGEKDLAGQIGDVMGDLLKANQDSGGQLGDYLVSQATGEIYNYVEGARKYINKIILIADTFVARVKGEIVKYIKLGVDKLVEYLLKPDVLGNSLKTIQEFLDKLLENLGCSISDLADRLAQWITDTLFDYLYSIFQAAACQVDTFVNGLINQITSFLNTIIDSILGPLTEILGVIAEPLNLVGGAINSVFNLLGISCDGPSKSCVKTRKVCTNCGSEDKSDFLDDLLKELSDGPLEGDYVCDDANNSISASRTNIDFIGGTFDENNGETEKLIVYSIPRAFYVREGQIATFTVVRSGDIDVSSSINYISIQSEEDNAATENLDYIPVSGVLGFAPQESEKSFTMQILNDSINEKREKFLLNFSKSTGVHKSYFELSEEQSQTCEVFILASQGSDGDDDLSSIVDSSVNLSPNDGGGLFPTQYNNFPPPTDITFDTTNVPVDPNAPTITPVDPGSNGEVVIELSADKTSVVEGDFVTFTIRTTNVASGTVYGYSLFGLNITSDDILGGNLFGTFTMSNPDPDNENKLKETVTIGINDDSLDEGTEVLTFSINGTGRSINVVILSDKTDEDDNIITEILPPDQSEYPVADDPITDENGEIIEIPILVGGGRFVEPPKVLISGKGYGASAIALLNDRGKVTEIRITNPGRGYRVNLPQNSRRQCVIDGYTMIRPGQGYTEQPQVFVNGSTGVAEAVIENGRVVSLRVLDRALTFNSYPRVTIVGGNGFGALFLPAFRCLDIEDLERNEYAKIGTGKYIDCP